MLIMGIRIFFAFIVLNDSCSVLLLLKTKISGDVHHDGRTETTDHCPAPGWGWVWQDSGSAPDFHQYGEVVLPAAQSGGQDSGAVCEQCGKPIEQNPGRKRKRFCCDACRNKWWNAHLELVKRKAVYTYTCPACGKKFTVYGNSHRKFCSHACYIAYSIQRFARNTVDLLRTVRHLKELGIEVWFEKENIYTMSGDGELMMTILASFAQEESRSISENVRWRVKKRFEKGIPNGRFHVYGYRWKGNQLVVKPEEAAVVKFIYANFLKGVSAETTEKQLEEQGVKSFNGKHFGNSSIRMILQNITYTGNMLFQKEYVADPITGKSKINRGELPQYFVENTHEAIIPMEIYNRPHRHEIGQPLCQKYRGQPDNGTQSSSPS